MNAQDLAALLQKEIPLSQHMGVRDFKVASDEVSLLLPLKPNINHKSTLFGGSLYSASALACYGLFLAGLRENGVDTNNIVIAEGNIKYTNPVTADAKVVATWSSAADKERFFKTLLAKKKARVMMTAKSYVNGQVCTDFNSLFAAWV